MVVKLSFNTDGLLLEGQLTVFVNDSWYLNAGGRLRRFICASLKPVIAMHS